MKRLTTLLMTLMLMSAALWAEETITVSAKSSDISEGLDLKVVAKLFAEAKNLEEFEALLNNPDSAFCNLDLNGDGQVDYLRVVETGEGNKRLIVLQAVLAKDIYQDVASIYVEKDEKNEVSVQVIGDEYVYGTNYVIEPVYIYRPVIYDWFWSDAWYAWHSPWYWGYYPNWWYAHNCWAHDWYWHHCYAYHHHHHCCSFRHGPEVHRGYHDLHRGVARREFATAHPERSFHQRNAGMTNARDIRKTSGTRHRQASAGSRPATTSPQHAQRNEGARRNDVRRNENTQQRETVRRSEGARRSTDTRRTTDSRRVSREQAAPVNRSASTQNRSAATVNRSSASTNRSTSASPSRSSSVSTGRSASTPQVSQPARSQSSSRSGSGSYSSGSRSSHSGSSSSSFSGGSRSAGSSGSSSHSAGSRGGGGSGVTRR